MERLAMVKPSGRRVDGKGGWKERGSEAGRKKGAARS